MASRIFECPSCKFPSTRIKAPVIAVLNGNGNATYIKWDYEALAECMNCEYKAHLIDFDVKSQ